MTRIAYSDLDSHPTIAALDAAFDDPGDHTAHHLARQLFAESGSIAEAVADAVLGSSGPLATRAARGDGVDPSDVIRRELDDLGRLAHVDTRSLIRDLGLGDLPTSSNGSAVDGPPAAGALRDRLIETPDWGDHAADLIEFYASEGYGPLAVHRVLRWDADGLRGVDRPEQVTPADLVGGEFHRRDLSTALAAFAAGGPAVDALLYGPPGTGKSTIVRALAASHADRGLRLIQVDRADVGTLRGLMDRVADGPRCLVLLDDLVFDDDDRSDRELRGVLEGDVAARPANVAVWATSNRMRLLQETRTQREDDLESDGGRGERSALASRFGLLVAVSTITPDEFVDVAGEYVRRHVGTVPDDVDVLARRFAVDRGLTPRAARQFADLYVARNHRSA